MTNELENFLAHYGKKGMRWGVSNNRRSDDYLSVKPLRKKNAQALSDADLKKAIARMSLEKQYKDLNPKGLSKANKIVLGVLAIGATVNSAIAFKNSAAGKAVIAGVKSAFAAATKVKPASNSTYANATTIALKAITR